MYHVEYDEEEYKKVVRSIKTKDFQRGLCMCILRLFIIMRQDALDAAYRFLISGFKAGSDIAYMRTDPGSYKN